MARKKKYTPQQKAIIRRYYAMKAQQVQRQKEVPQRIEAKYPHFRYYKKSKHPALIVGEQMIEGQTSGSNVILEEYRYRKVMHSDKDGRHLNEMVVPNPDPDDKEPMYIAKRVRHDLKDNFEEKPLPWEYPKE